ncbi:MAG TPA: SusC/RagA family TonB-linked outer membrane protein [Puia sp.]|nr:SusC/RagA family TonB-linked outer membrane protein [Puia sp.]
MQQTALLICLTCLVIRPAIAQEKITGVVDGSDGLRLAGVSVSVKGSSSGTQSDSTGHFSILAKKGDLLVFSFIGYETQSIRIEDDMVLHVLLTALVNNLNEVVVTGYVSEIAKNISGSVAIVKPRDLVAVPAGQVEQMLQGRVAGLTVITSGEPGSESNIRLHGIGNFGDVTPLYIIDGVQGDINSLNPYDIESLQVLKDAGAYSIYGVRGANGVIVITTKKGKTGKPAIAYDAYVGETFPTQGLHFLNPQQNADILWTALKNSNQVDSLGYPSDPWYGYGPKPLLPDYLVNLNYGYPANAAEADPSLYNINPGAPIYQIMKFSKGGTDWYHEVFKPAFSQSHTVAVSGGMDKSHYLFSFGYLDQEGTMLNTYLKRYTARINTEFAVDNFLRMGENLQLVYRDNPKFEKNLPDYTNEISRVLRVNPGIPVYDINGAFVAVDDPNFGPQSNPVGARVLAKNDIGNNWQVFGNAFAELDLLKYVTLRSSFGGTLTNYNSTLFHYGSYAGSSNSLAETSGYSRSWTWTNTLNFSRTFSHGHHLEALLGLEEISNYNRELGGSRQDFITDNPNYRFLSNGSPTLGITNYSFASSSYLSSFISRLNYIYKDRYILSATLRSDGSSIFGPENRYGWFPAVSIAWRMTEENFMWASTWLTDLKLRASWGSTGFYGNTDPFNQYTLYNGNALNAFYDIAGISSGAIQQGFSIVRIGNPKTGWQKDVVSNIGLDAILWNGKLSVTADWYNKTSTGLLMPIPLPDYIQGDATPPNVNIGNIRNSGIDLMLGSKGKISRNWRWELLVTFSHYDNKIIKLNNLPYIDANGGQTADNGFLVRNEVGYPIGSFFGYKVIGLFKDNEDVAKSPTEKDAAPGRFKYLDANKDGVINDLDRVHFGNPNPQFSIGINIGINYKNVDFSTFFYGSFGNDIYNGPGAASDIATSAVHRQRILNDSWTPQNKNGNVPRLEAFSYFSTFDAVNSYPLEKGSYLRNKSMMMGYTFPLSSLSKIHIKRLRIYVQAVNLFTLTKYSGLDPELYGYVSQVPLGNAQDSKSSFGIDKGNYPNNQIQLLAGLNLGF